MSKGSFSRGFWDGATFGFYSLFALGTLIVTYYDQVKVFLLSR